MNFFSKQVMYLNPIIWEKKIIKAITLYLFTGLPNGLGGSSFIWYESGQNRKASFVREREREGHWTGDAVMVLETIFIFKGLSFLWLWAGWSFKSHLFLRNRQNNFLLIGKFSKLHMHQWVLRTLSHLSTILSRIFFFF